MSETDRIVVYTDGACSGNPGPGGWAWIRPDGPFAAGSAADTTNQRMELKAALEAVVSASGPTHIVSDSTYVVNCFRDGWWKGWQQRGWRNAAKKPVANRDLWEPLIEAVQQGDVTFEWVKGHAGDEWNDLADRLAVEACVTQRPRSGSERPTEIGEADSVAKDRGSVTRDATGREKPPGHGLVVLGMRSIDTGNTRLPVRLADVIEAKAAMHDDLVVLSGLRMGAEIEGARAALRVGARLVAVLPYPDPARGWPSERRESFDEMLAAADDTIVLQSAHPADAKAARAALARRDAWFGRNAMEAVVVWDHDDDDVGRLVRSMTDALGELDVWIVDPTEI